MESNNDIIVSFFVPCLNEENNIIPTIDNIKKVINKLNINSEIIVVDDNSTDNTYETVLNYKQQSDLNIKIIKKNFTQGLGTNYVDTAFSAKGKYYMLVNGDNAEPYDTIYDILSLLGKSDIIIPYYGENDKRNDTRKFISKIFTKIVNFVSGNNIPYYNGPVLHLRYNVMRWSPDTHGYAYQAELITRIIAEKATYETIQIKMLTRKEGESNAFTVENVLSVLHSLLQIFLRRLRFILFYRNQ